MGHISEPKEVDFLIKSPPLTDEERKEISEFIRKRKQEKGKSSSAVRKKENQQQQTKESGDNEPSTTS